MNHNRSYFSSLFIIKVTDSVKAEHILFRQAVIFSVFGSLSHDLSPLADPDMTRTIVFVRIMKLKDAVKLFYIQTSDIS